MLPVGLTNKDTLCYLNASIQCLAYTTPFVRGLNTVISTEDVASKTDLELTLAVNTVCHQIETSSTTSPVVLDAEPLCLTVSTRFASRQQHDAAELLQYLFTSISEELKKNKMKDVIRDVFGFQLGSKLTCGECDRNTLKSEDQTILSIEATPISDDDTSVDVQDSLSRFTRNELLDSNTVCTKCGKTGITYKQIQIQSWSLVLVIHMKIFDNNRNKITTGVTFPLRLSNVLARYGPNNLDKDELYELYAIIHHTGAPGSSIDSGHYTATVCIKNVWYTLNDQIVTRTTYKEVEKIQPYMLFYKRVVVLPTLGISNIRAKPKAMLMQDILVATQFINFFLS